MTEAVRATKPTLDLDWLIVGGGLHGVHIAARLLGEASVDPSRLRLLDPQPELLALWRANTAVTGMDYLRSPGVHHLDLEPFSLIHLAGKRRHQRRGLLRAPYDRPALDLFNTHCQGVIRRFELADLHLHGHAKVCEPGSHSVRVTSCDGTAIEAARVVLAIGASDQPAWPEWAPRDEPRIRHVFARDFVWPSEPGRCVVVGGGISAAQVALRLISEGWSVDLVSRHPMQIHPFDSDPGWLGPKRMPTFRREKSPDGRRRLIQMARHRGSVTPEVHRAMRRAISADDLRLHQADIDAVDTDDDSLRLHLSTRSGDATRLDTSNILLATGFERRRPGGPMVDDLVESAALRCAACGYPIVDKALRWHPRVHVTGPLAELELGPVARNIAGARRAGDRLVEWAERVGP